VPYHWTQVVNIKRDPFETSIGEFDKTLMGVGGALAGPVTAYQYDWNMLPIGQALWLKHLQTYIDFPPLQNPASYDLEQVMQQVREMKSNGLSDYYDRTGALAWGAHSSLDQEKLSGKEYNGDAIDPPTYPLPNLDHCSPCVCSSLCAR